MKTAKEFADFAAHTYQLLKCDKVATVGPHAIVSPALEMWRGNQPDVRMLIDVAQLPKLVLRHSQEPGDPVDACVFNAEVYPGDDETLFSPFKVPVRMDDPAFQTGLLTIAVTREGGSHVKLFQYYEIANGGLEFEQHSIKPEDSGILTYVLKGMWENERNKG